MSANYKVSMPYCLGALELPLPFYHSETGIIAQKSCTVYILCPPDGEDIGISVELTGPSLTVYTSSQTRSYFEYDGVKLSPLYDGVSGISSHEGGEIFFPSTGLYEGWLTFDYSVEPTDHVYSADIPANLASSLSRFRIGCNYVLVLDQESITAFLKTGVLEGYHDLSFPGLAELLSGRNPNNLITDDPDFDQNTDHDAVHPATASMENF